MCSPAGKFRCAKRKSSHSPIFWNSQKSFFEVSAMSDDLEKQMRAKAEALLVARTTETAADRHKRRLPQTKEQKAMYKRIARMRALRKKAKQVEARKALRPARPWCGHKSQGVPLAERLLARTEPDKWYYFRQLKMLMPETGKNGLNAIVFQKLPTLGWIERKALLDVASLSADAMGLDPANAFRVLSQPRYVYRIGAQQGERRAQAREKLSALTSERFE
jgi:hypothetical protein